jgi:hypothetical protein
MDSRRGMSMSSTRDIGLQVRLFSSLLSVVGEKNLTGGRNLGSAYSSGPPASKIRVRTVSLLSPLIPPNKNGGHQRHSELVYRFTLLHIQDQPISAVPVCLKDSFKLGVETRLKYWIFWFLDQMDLGTNTSSGLTGDAEYLSLPSDTDIW